MDQAAQRVRVHARRRDHAGQHRRVAARVGALDGKSPGVDGCPHARGPSLVACEHALQAFGLQHLDGLGQGVQQVGVGRGRPVAGGVHGHDLFPVPVRARQAGGARGRQCLLRQGIEADARRQHQALLRAAHRDVDTPLVVPVVGAGQARDGVDDQQCGMARGIDGIAHRADVGGHAGRGLVVHHAHRADVAAGVRAQPGLDVVGIDPVAPVAGLRQQWIGVGRGDQFGIQAEAGGHAVPQRREMPGLVHQHLVARTECVAQRRLPGARARGRVDDDRLPGPEDPLHALDHLAAQPGELGAAVVDCRQAHRAQQPVGHRARPGDLQEVVAGGV